MTSSINSLHFFILILGIAFTFIQVHHVDKQWWFSVLATIMSLIYSTIGLGLGVSKIVENKGIFKGSISLKFWRIFADIGNIAFGYTLHDYCCNSGQSQFSSTRI
ncbi:amino acid permease 5 [Lathyrus oleraceus]|uniref:amino acid permease 5 n=1 Tax=Pisum sativum TaxID=3888 RepID=UPI0021CE0416|nr:amino acid permease 5-like [Pisum sativum]